MDRVSVLLDSMGSAMEEIELEGCSLDDCERVFDAGYAEDIEKYAGDNSGKATEYASNAGLLKVCEHLWTRIIENGKRRVAKAIDEETLDPFCCIKQECSGERIHVDLETGKYRVVSTHASDRCFYHRKNVGLHFSMLRDRVLVAVKSTLLEFHPSMSEDIVEFMDKGAEVRCISGKHLPMPSEYLFDSIVERDLRSVREEMSPCIFGERELSPNMSLPFRDESLRYAVDVLDIAQKVVYSHYKVHGCQYRKCEEADRIKCMCSRILEKFGSITNFYLIAETNGSMMALEKRLRSSVKAEEEAA
jgi:hypothetical protein